MKIAALESLQFFYSESRGFHFVAPFVVDSRDLKGAAQAPYTGVGCLHMVLFLSLDPLIF